MAIEFSDEISVQLNSVPLSLNNISDFVVLLKYT